MSKIKIKNFGPIKEGYLEDEGWIDVKKVTVFIGNQGSGKSTVAKLITTFMWIEKALTRGDYDAKWFSRKNKFKNQFLWYFRLVNYFPNSNNPTQSLIEYKGDSFHITLRNDGGLDIEEIKNSNYPLPQIMYVPAERNFIANVRKPKALKLTSDALIEFVTEFDNAKNELKGSMVLPINNVEVEYQKVNDIVFIKGKDYKINLAEASSGFQSLVPLYLVSWFLSNSVKRQSENSKEPLTSQQREQFRQRMKLITENNGLNDELKRIAISEMAKQFTKTAFINIVEEPEQNLFPTSQWEMLKSLLEFNNINAGNKLIMTTHSPFIINYLTLSIKGNSVLQKIRDKKKLNELKEKFESIMPMNSCIKGEDSVVYELTENGTIKKLETYEGLPSDNNFLNVKLAETNEVFDKLLELEENAN